jgi:hypothetical protein
LRGWVVGLGLVVAPALSAGTSTTASSLHRVESSFGPDEKIPDLHHVGGCISVPLTVPPSALVLIVSLARVVVLSVRHILVLIEVSSLRTVLVWYLVLVREVMGIVRVP